jgi:phytoene dehydrogenase-like protein
MGVVSPYMQTLPLAKHGLEWAWSPAAIAHPFDDGDAAVLEESLEQTCANLGEDGAAWRKLMKPFTDHSAALFDEILRPIRLLPRHPFLMARFGLAGLQSATMIARRFKTARAKALFAGCAAHSFVPLTRAGSASFGLALAVAGHATGWPAAKGGSFAIIQALASLLRSLGGEIRTGHPVRSLRDVPASRAVLFDLSPRQLADIAGDELPKGYVRKLRRFRFGPGVFKLDWALSGPIPWKSKECSRAATVHIGPSIEAITHHEDVVWRGGVSDTPFTLVAQQSLFDSTRAPQGQHTGWAYCHVPHGSTEDMTDRIERQIERMAPGFRDLILARHSYDTARYEEHNANFIGGDIAGGANNLAQFLTRPFLSRDPYATPNRRLYICSSSTPPGGGVHGMCGYWAAKSAMRRVFA